MDRLALLLYPFSSWTRSFFKRGFNLFSISSIYSFFSSSFSSSFITFFLYFFTSSLSSFELSSPLSFSFAFDSQNSFYLSRWLIFSDNFRFYSWASFKFSELLASEEISTIFSSFSFSKAIFCSSSSLIFSLKHLNSTKDWS